MLDCKPELLFCKQLLQDYCRDTGRLIFLVCKHENNIGGTILVAKLHKMQLTTTAPRAQDPP